MRSLEWRDVDPRGSVIRLRPEVSENEDGRLLLLGGELLAIIERARVNRRPDCRFVFHDDGQPIGDFRKTWKRACAAVGVSGPIVHDLRRFAVRNLIRAGIPECTAMPFSGHKTREIFDRYSIVRESDLAEAAERLHAYVEATRSQATVVSIMSAIDARCGAAVGE